MKNKVVNKIINIILKPSMLQGAIVKSNFNTTKYIGLKEVICYMTLPPSVCIHLLLQISSFMSNTYSLSHGIYLFLVTTIVLSLAFFALNYERMGEDILDFKRDISYMISYVLNVIVGIIYNIPKILSFLITACLYTTTAAIIICYIVTCCGVLYNPGNCVWLYYPIFKRDLYAVINLLPYLGNCIWENRKYYLGFFCIILVGIIWRRLAILSFYNHFIVLGLILIINLIIFFTIRIYKGENIENISLRDILSVIGLTIVIFVLIFYLEINLFIYLYCFDEIQFNAKFENLLVKWSNTSGFVFMDQLPQDFPPTVHSGGGQGSSGNPNPSGGGNNLTPYHPTDGRGSSSREGNNNNSRHNNFNDNDLDDKLGFFNLWHCLTHFKIEPYKWGISYAGPDPWGIFNPIFLDKAGEMDTWDKVTFGRRLEREKKNFDGFTLSSLKSLNKLEGELTADRRAHHERNFFTKRDRARISLYNIVDMGNYAAHSGRGDDIKSHTLVNYRAMRNFSKIIEK